jgi:hypothetical protein
MISGYYGWFGNDLMLINHYYNLGWFIHYSSDSGVIKLDQLKFLTAVKPCQTFDPHRSLCYAC